MIPADWFGIDSEPPRRTPLTAGPLDLVYVDGDLRDIRFGRHEILRRIYLVFQDRNWTARPWVITKESIYAGPTSFEISYHATGTFDAAGFEVEVQLSGDNEGTISVDVDGTAATSFIRNRLGLCVLHPMSAAGSACIIEGTSGDTIESRFPLDISPHQPFLDIRAITHEFMPGAWASTRISGDTFEMEDHRNWSDASFKTYCTPISLPFPVTVEAGESVWHSLTLAVDVEDVDVEPLDDTIALSAEPTSVALPELGLQLGETDLSPEQVARLRELRPGHVRLDVAAGDVGAVGRVTRAAEQATALGARLVVALFVSDPAQLSQFAPVTSLVSTWLVFDADEKVAGEPLAVAARTALGSQARIGGGTNLYFTELNRQPPSHDLDVLAFSINAQVHAADSQTLMQNVLTQRVIAEQAARLARGADLLVSPVTLRPRFNPNATEPELDVSNTSLPANVDARQSAWIAAAWTALSVKYLAEPGTISAITYYETVGPRGVMADADQVFPVFDVLKALAGFTAMRPVTSSRPDRVDALLVTDDAGRQRLIAVNHSDADASVRLVGFPGRDALELPSFSLQIIDSEGPPS